MNKDTWTRVAAKARRASDHILNVVDYAKYTVMAFAVTWIALIVYARTAELAPFGDQCLLSMDLHGQYYPMMWEKLSDFFSVWSWDGALGFSSLVQSAYYTNSVFLLLLLPFSGYARVVALHMILFLKLSLAAAAFTCYVSRKFKKYDIFSAVFGISYALGAYTLAFLNQPMWLDIVLILPLILCALDRLIEGGHPIPYALLLAFAIYSNFYIAWALCLFLVLWFIVSVIAKPWGGFRDLVKTGLKFAGASVLGGALCAFMVFPLFLHMENWISSSVGFPEEREWYHSLSQIVDSFSTDLAPSWEFGPANVFCGSAALFFVLIFLFNKEISLRRKCTMLPLAAFLFVSFELNVLDFIWHGLHFPNQLPGRQSFLFIFVILLIGYEAIAKYKGLILSGVIASLLAAVGFFLIGMSESKNADGRIDTIITLVIVFVLTALLLDVKKRPRGAHAAKALLSAVLIFDICTNAVFVLGEYMRTSSASAYVKNEAQILEYVEKYENGEEGFYRSELTPKATFNNGQLYGFKGMTYYSSTMNGDIYTLMQRLGNRVYAKNVSTVYMPTPFQDMMFGVKYHYMTSGKTLSYGKLLEKTSAVSVYESPYALPIAYAVRTNIKKIESSDKKDFLYQEKFIGLAANMKKKLVYNAEILNTEISNATLKDGYLNTRDKESAVTYQVEYEMTRDGYFFVDLDFTVGNYEINVADRYKLTGSCSADPILDIGYMHEGDRITVKVKISGYSRILCGVNGYIVDKDALSDAYEKLSSEALQVQYASDTVVRGEITVAQNSVLYASIPAENGWEVYIDGTKTETYDLGMGLLFCDIEAGTHTVEYRYRAPGLASGIAVSSAAALIGVAVCVYYGIKKKKARVRL